MNTLRIVVLTLFFLLTLQSTQAQTLTVTLSGSSTPRLLGANVNHVVAFRWSGNAWQQIPAQINERETRNLPVLIGDPPSPSVNVLVRTDVNTVVGSDSNVTFDADDDLLLSPSDAGLQAPTNTPYPANTLVNTGEEIAIGSAYIYVFIGDGTLPIGAGIQRVTKSGTNNNSIYTSSIYQRGFIGRWSNNLMKFTASGIDILDVEFFNPAPGDCKRTLATGDAGPGTYLASYCGALACVRDQFGINSFRFTQSERTFSVDTEESITFMRGHPGNSGGMRGWDFSGAASGMIYSNSNSPNGVSVNGVQDAISGTQPFAQWEHWTGTQGSLSAVYRITTDIPNLTTQVWYQDQVSASPKPCTGSPTNNSMYGSSTLRITSAVPNTDPRQVPFNVLTLRQILRYGPVNATNGQAQSLSVEVDSPPVVSVLAF